MKLVNQRFIFFFKPGADTRDFFYHRSLKEISKSSWWVMNEIFSKIHLYASLDHIIADLKERLSSNVMNLFHLHVKLPKPKINSDEITIKGVVNTFNDLIRCSTTSAQELLLWLQKWKWVIVNKEKLLESVLETLEDCDIDMYLIIHKLLHILATLSVRVATAECRFSTVHRLKTWFHANIRK